MSSSYYAKVSREASCRLTNNDCCNVESDFFAIKVIDEQQISDLLINLGSVRNIYLQQVEKLPVRGILSERLEIRLYQRIRKWTVGVGIQRKEGEWLHWNVRLTWKDFFSPISYFLLTKSQESYYNKEPQSNLSTTTTLGTPKKWLLYRRCRFLEVFQSKLVLKLVWPDLVWSLLTGGRYSEVVINTGLTVVYTRREKWCTKCFIVNCYS